MDDGDGVLACADCDDSEALASPDRPEVCDGLDNDCDGDVDEASALDAATWYADADSDGFGSAATSQVACDQPTGFVANAGDCDDLSALAYPGSAEVCDSVDNDCDGTVDGPNPLDATTYWADADLDGAGDPASPILSCALPPGAATNDDDCDDTNSAVLPGAPETCNGIDDDCDTVIDDGASPLATWYADGDGDGQGNAIVSVDACAAPPGFVALSNDCDDGDATVYDGATELCDGIDTDCDGAIPADEADADGDGVSVCDGDCDDAQPASSPNLSEVCDGIDNDCDGSVDNGATAGTWYPDIDGDGYGNPSFPVVTCTPASGYVIAGTDCDDTDATNYPTATELCDGVDNDCDGVLDNGLSPLLDWYEDVDGDGYGDVATLVQACAQPPGLIADGTDCDDTDASFSPAALEDCTDAVDNDCDALIDCDELVDCKPIEPTCWVCGDGTLDPDEECDDGGIVPGDGCDELCLDEAGPIDLTGVYSSFPSGGRTVYFWQSDSNLPLNATYGTFCEDRGLSWYSPVSSADAQNVIDTAYNYDTWHTWIITKAVTGNATWGGFSVAVDSPSCVDYSTTGWSAIRKWACSYCEPELYDQTRCWDSNHVYDWLVCEGP